MRSNDANPDKTTGLDENPVSIVLNGQTIDAAHHITSQNNRLLHLYINERAGGIDVTVPIASDKPAYARSDTGRRALGIDSHCAGDDSEHELVADGGREVPACTCGADLIETANLCTELAPKPGARLPRPAMREVPAAECGECDESVGALFGIETVVAIWEARNEAPFGTSGCGRDAVKFAEDVDYVEYDGDGYLVNHAVSRDTIEICQVNERPITAPVDECTPTDVYGNPLSDDDDGERLVTDGGIPGHTNMSQANGDTHPVEDYDSEIDRTIDKPEGPCENPLCDDPECLTDHYDGVRINECSALVSDVRAVADASWGYDTLLMPHGDREEFGAVFAELNRQGRLDGGDE